MVNADGKWYVVVKQVQEGSVLDVFGFVELFLCFGSDKCPSTIDNFKQESNSPSFWIDWKDFVWKQMLV